MVKRSRKEKPAPPVNRTRDEDNKRLATVEEADAKWERQLAARDPPEKKEPEPRKEAIEEEFISFSPMSEFAQDESDDASIDAILPFNETMSDAGESIEEDITAEPSTGDVG